MSLAKDVPVFSQFTARLTSMPAEKINQAVQDCLKECYSSSSPLATLVEYSEKLRHNGKWEAYEIDEFETAVRRILKELMNSH